MQTLQIFLIQLVLSISVIALVAHWKLRPILSQLNWPDVIFWLALPHAFRHLGLVFLVPGIVSAELPAGFAAEAAYGDFIAGLLAVLTLIAAQYRSYLMVPLAWSLTLFGTGDLINALSHAEAVPHLHAAWYIPTFVVPVLLVTHAMLLFRLLGVAPRGITPAQTV